jgi:transcriptional regulator with XRE-family HTH domain
VNNSKRISSNLKALREERGLKQKFVAERIGVKPNHYSQIENGHLQPQIKHLLILRDLFGVSLDEIFFKDQIAKCDKQAI